MKVRHLRQWALSRKQLPIELYHSLTVELSQKCGPLIVIGGVHGDEPEGVALARALLQWLLTEGSQPGKVQVPWILIPCLNPDGYTAGTRVNGAGVDLNRNYPAKSWSPQFTQDRYHPGPSPGSEPEIQSLVSLFASVQPRLVIHCHSWNPCIVYTGAPARRDAERLARSSGYALQETIGYDTPGSLSEFGWKDQGIPIICIEEQEHSPLESVWPHFAQGFAEIFADGSARSVRE